MSRCYACCQENCGRKQYDCDCHEPVLAVPKAPLALINPLKCPCKTHRKFQAKRKPTSGCEECWRYYVKANP